MRGEKRIGKHCFKLSQTFNGKIYAGHSVVQFGRNFDDVFSRVG